MGSSTTLHAAGRLGGRHGDWCRQRGLPHILVLLKYDALLHGHGLRCPHGRGAKAKWDTTKALAASSPGLDRITLALHAETVAPKPPSIQEGSFGSAKSNRSGDSAARRGRLRGSKRFIA